MTPTPPKSTCFVVQPMGERSDSVFETYIEPALSDGYDLTQPGDFSYAITDDVFHHLRDDTVTIAFLGSPTQLNDKWLWNPNVMLEAGYRLGVGRPIIFLREKRPRSEDPLLPFDLQNTSVIELLSDEDEKLKVHRDRIKKQIRQYVDEASERSKPKPGSHPFYTNPAISLAFGGGAGKIIAASEDAAAFYRFPPEKNLVELSITEVVNKLQSEMAPSQRAAFNQEQTQLLGMIWLGQKPAATVCIVFGKDPLKPGDPITNAYLPIITRFSTLGEPTVLEVFYLDVTATAVVGPDGVVRCNLAVAKAAGN